MSSSTSPVLLFDVMSTLVYDPIHREIPAFFDLSLEELYEHKHPTAWVEFERGEMSEQAFYDCYFPGRAESIDGAALRRLLYDSYRWIDEMQPLLAGLADADLEIHTLSNYPTWYEIIEDKLRLSRYLQWTFVSCLTGVRKPDERAYRRVLTTLDIAAENCLFVDDRAINCEAARKLGMDAILFRDATDLRDALRRRKLL